ncbi:MAG: GMC family oxidoreductase N-terminal domain-containing protein [Calditrichia bacterium]
MQLSPKEIKVLSAACDAIIPSIDIPGENEAFLKRKASDLPVATEIARTISGLKPEDQKEFKQLLFLLGSPLLGATWFGPPKGILALSNEQREKLMQSWCNSKLSDLRKAFQTLKKLSCFIFYGYSDNQDNPNWQAIGYPGPLSEPPTQSDTRIATTAIPTDGRFNCEVLVIGSGAGGGVAAGELAEAGQDVIVVEKGGNYSETDFTQREQEMVLKLYDSNGALVTSDGGVTVFAGSCLGGGTTVNWAGAFRTPDYILQSWADNHQAPHFLSEEYKQSFEAIEKATSINLNESPHNPQNQALWDGCEKLGYDKKLIARNSDGCSKDDCQSCGYCGFGCQRGAKKGTLKTFLQRASDAGARFITGCEIDRILIRDCAAIGAEGVVINGEGHRQRITIHAEKVVLAAGSIHTPAVLMRSGLEHPHLGKHLYFHPTVAVSATYKHVVNSWWGQMMSAVSDEFTQLNGNYGFKLETPPVHSGTIGLAMPWTSGREHKEGMLKAQRRANFIVLTRDRDGGSVSLSKSRKPVLHYKLSAFDKKHVLRGIEESVRIHLAAGAEEVLVPHNKRPIFKADQGVDKLEQFLATIPNLSWKANQFPLFTAHQMGTCRMGGNERTHPVAPDGSFRGVRNLYIGDASAFPECSGANPMVSIQAMTHYTTMQIKSSLNVTAV